MTLLRQKASSQPAIFSVARHKGFHSLDDIISCWLYLQLMDKGQGSYYHYNPLLPSEPTAPPPTTQGK